MATRRQWEKKLNQGKLISVILNKIKKADADLAEIAGPCFVIGVGCLLLKYGLDQIITYFS